MNNKELLYSTGSYTQYLIITYNGKESEKDYLYIYYIYVNRITVLYTRN